MPPGGKHRPAHGGRRKGAGRPKGAPTRVLSVRVPAASYDYLRSFVLAVVAKLAQHEEPRR